MKLRICHILITNFEPTDSVLLVSSCLSLEIKKKTHSLTEFLYSVQKFQLDQIVEYTFCSKSVDSKSSVKLYRLKIPHDEDKISPIIIIFDINDGFRILMCNDYLWDVRWIFYFGQWQHYCPSPIQKCLCPGSKSNQAINVLSKNWSRNGHKLQARTNFLLYEGVMALVSFSVFSFKRIMRKWHKASSAQRSNSI